MRMNHFGAALVLVAALAGPAIAQPSLSMPVGEAVTELDHGGGCRKSSPRGQCCHMETKTGRVHCH